MILFIAGVALATCVGRGVFQRPMGIGIGQKVAEDSITLHVAMPGQQAARGCASDAILHWRHE